MNDNTHNSLLLLKKHLKDVQGQWIPSSRIHNTGIGKTLEDLIQKQEDNLSLPDLDGNKKPKSKLQVISDFVYQIPIISKRLKYLFKRAIWY